MNIELVKTELLNRRNALMSKLQVIREGLAKTRSVTGKPSDTSNTIRLEAQRELRQLSTTLDVMAAGRYGYCQDCGAPIAEQDMKLSPYMLLCRHCALD